MVIGLLGGIGSGKSTVAGLFVLAGAEAVDADEIAREVLDTSPVKDRVSRRFGPGVLGPAGEVDRRRLADLVFTDRALLDDLNAIVHPPVIERIRERIRSHRLAGQNAGPPGGAPADLLVLDVPLLLDSPLQTECDALVFVDAAPSIRRSRTAARGWPPGEIERRESFQVPLESKRAAARWIVDNSGTLETTRQAVERVIREISQPSSPKGQRREEHDARRGS